MTKEEMKQLSTSELVNEVESLRRQLFDLKMQRAAGQVKDYSQFKKMRANVARMLTFIGQKRRFGESNTTSV